MTIEAMSEERFWAIIDATVPLADDPERQKQALLAALKTLKADDIAAFEAAFREHVDRAFTWDLWGAAYVVHGGCSDDGFEYFRVWLLSKGREVFETVLNDPDRLARMELEPGPDGLFEFEEFAYVAAKAWKAVGAEGDISAKIDVPAGLGDPDGEPFEEDEDHLSVRFPRLWKRYGEDPLG
ncbi:MAG: DUF4240 domain-containing protein [Hyphomicrobiaceae bacterium]|nr:DUF4240 domain-containing protein [Hyphomicrobiaceae bacterium]